MIFFETLVISMAIYALWNGIALPATYFIASILLGILLVILVLKGLQRYSIFYILLMYLLMRNVYYLASHYTSIPFGDTYQNYGVLRNFLQRGNVFVIHTQTPFPFEDRFVWFSEWPLLETLAQSLCLVSSIDPFHIVLLLPFVLSIGQYVFAYLIVEKIRQSLNLSGLVTTLSLFAYAISPELIFYSSIFVHNNMGLLLLNAIFYLLIKRVSKRDRVLTVLTIFFAISLVFAHHFTSFVALFYMFFFFAVAIIGKYLSSGIKKAVHLFSTRTSTSFFSVLAMVTLAVLFSYWNSYATIIWPTIATKVTLRGMGEITAILKTPYYPNSLTPTWGLLLLRLRDALIYVPVTLGFLFIIRMRKASPQKFFVICSSLALGTLFVYTSIVAEEPSRIAMYAMPFVGLCYGIFHGRFRNKSRFFFNMLVPALIVLMTFSSFTGLWGHNYMPAHLYDPSINQVDMGEHNFHYLRLTQFFDNYIEYENFNYIVADDVYPLYVVLPPKHYEKIQTIEIGIQATKSHVLIVEFSHLNLYYYYYYVPPEVKPWEIESTRSSLERHLDQNYHVIYSDGDFRIRRNCESADK